MKILPDVGSISRLIILSVVVLPQPDGPSSTQISPSATSILMRSAATTVPAGVSKALVKLSSLIMPASLLRSSGVREDGSRESLSASDDAAPTAADNRRQWRAG